MADAAQDIQRPNKWTLSGDGPLYLQLRRRLEDEIRNGGLQPGAPLPSEREIADSCQVSRVTVRKAVQSLVRDGVIVQRRGSGTTVARPVDRVEQSLSRLTSFSEDMARRSMTGGSVWIERGVYPASPREMMALGLGAEAQVARIARLRMANGVPLAIERAAISTQYLPDPQRIAHSLYAALAELGNKPVRAIQRISAVNLGVEDAALLEVSEGNAGLSIERISYSAQGAAIEFTRSIYRGDAYDFVAELKIGDDGK
ncbi:MULTISPECIES: GntR family transcriptional regulator [Rhodomicrobium]|uniref:GntR family transcriptional regulator n=1 Tax=Rhodomicrobium TaxID=1068 RepID=UPI000B4ADE77|nr:MULTISPECIES: GntR family transcriptional regulator [Rhodomicrobium]